MRLHSMNVCRVIGNVSIQPNTILYTYIKCCILYTVQYNSGGLRTNHFKGILSMKQMQKRADVSVI